MSLIILRLLISLSPSILFTSKIEIATSTPLNPGLLFLMLILYC